MNMISGLLVRIVSILKSLTALPPLAARITVGWVFIESGWGKLHHLDKVTAFFTELGLHAPSFQAHLVASTEFICGGLLLIGLLTRFVSFPLITIMVVAILTAKKDDLHGFSDLIGFSEYLYILLLGWLAVAGAGIFSLDALFSRKAKFLA